MEQQQQQHPNESSNKDQFESDPLLQPGAFIDPNPEKHPNPPTTPPNGVVGNKTNGKSPPSSSTVDPTPTPVSKKRSKPSDETPLSDRPAWLPPTWRFIERVRVNGASAGCRDKYYVCPVTNRRFRSKREVFHYLETGSTKKRKNADSDAADSTPATDSSAAKGKNSEAKAKKSEAKAKKSEGKEKKSEGKEKKKSSKKFNFDDAPAKVKWMLTDIYNLKWRPLVNGVDRVPESAKQEWSAAFTYLTLQNNGGNPFF